MISLIAIDLDDTLIAPDLHIPDENLTAIRLAIKSGVKVVIATARGWAGAKRFYDRMGLSTPIILSSGASTVDGQTGAVIRRSYLPLSFARDVVTFADEQQIALRVYVGSEVWNNFDYDPSNGKNKTIEIHVENLVQKLVEAPFQIFVKGEREAKLILERFGSEGDGYRCRHHVYADGIPELNILHPRSTKQDALADLCAAFDVPREQVMALGDSKNDLGMIAWAGIGVAMSWADDAVKEVADWVLADGTVRLTHDPDAEVAEAIFHHVLQQPKTEFAG